MQERILKMAKTITTHNGSAANRDHNIRNPKVTDKQEHINKSLSHQNVILYDENPRDAYRRIFGEALEKYNAKQKRKDRQIKDYYTHICKDAKKHPVYELIAQIGNRDDTGLDAPTEQECLTQYFDEWDSRNPNLKIIGGYLHKDEDTGTLHMHVDYIPVATGYTRGLEIQSSLVKALEQQGFRKDKEHPQNAQIQWEASENSALESICREHGIEVTHPQAEHRKHLDTDTFKAQKRLEELEQEIADVEEDVSINKGIAEQYQDNAILYRQKASEAISQLNATQLSIKAYRNHSKIVQSQLESESKALHSLRERKTDLEGKLAPLREDIDKQTRRLNSLKFQCEVESKAVNNLKEKKIDLEGQIEALQATLTTKEVESITYEKTFLGGVKGVTSKELDALKRTAAQVDAMTIERDQALATAHQAEERAVNAENRAKSAYQDANRQLQEKIREVEQDRPSMQMYRENVKLKRENDSLKNLFSFVMEQLETHFPQVFRIIEPQVRKKKQSRTNPEHSTVGRSWEHER